MARFVTGNELKECVAEIISNAEQRLIIISPYIKLHERYRERLRDTFDKDIQTTVIFRRSDNDAGPHSNIHFRDQEFFKSFRNIEVLCIKDLHAKLYANEKELLVTSMNMYRYSQVWNIEFGILLNLSQNSSFNREDAIMKRRILREVSNLMKRSDVYYRNLKDPGTEIFEFEKERLFDDRYEVLPAAEFDIESVTTIPVNGFCIRSGAPIPFNIGKPYSLKAYNASVREQTLGQGEQFCHLSGERSLGDTNLYRPILYKYWIRLVEKFPELDRYTAPSH